MQVGSGGNEQHTNGLSVAEPVMDSIKTEASRTGDEFRDLKNSRVTPSKTTSTGQPLTCMWEIVCYKNGTAD